MKKYLIGVAVLLLVSGGLWLATSAQAQAPACNTGHGRLLCYHNMVQCEGSTYADGGHKIQWSSNGGSTWNDGTTTDANGYFYQYLDIAYTGQIRVRGKPNCNGDDHKHTPCDFGVWQYNQANACTLEVGTIYNKECPEQK